LAILSNVQCNLTVPPQIQAALYVPSEPPKVQLLLLFCVYLRRCTSWSSCPPGVIVAIQRPSSSSAWFFILSSRSLLLFSRSLPSGCRTAPRFCSLDCLCPVSIFFSPFSPSLEGAGAALNRGGSEFLHVCYGSPRLLQKWDALSSSPQHKISLLATLPKMEVAVASSQVASI